MCGLFGWMSTGDPKRTNYATLPLLTRELALLARARGKDALGWASYRRGEPAPKVERSRPLLKGGKRVCEPHAAGGLKR